jgi:hypothetical protein
VWYTNFNDLRPFIIGLVLGIAACTDPTADELNGYPEKIDFENPAVRQQSIYIGLEGESYWSRDESAGCWNFTTDTLVVEITDKTSNGFVVCETLIREPGGRYSTLVDTSRDYVILIQNDTLVAPYSMIEMRSFLFGDFPFLGSLFFPLSNFKDHQVYILGWRTSHPKDGCYQEGYIENYQGLARTYKRLNVVIDNCAMMVDGPGYTWIYSRTAGMVRTYTVSAWFGNGWGWELLN